MDIELEYYKFLKEIYKAIEKTNSDQVSNSIKKDVKDLNQCFDQIKIELELYLTELDKVKVEINNEILIHFNKTINIYDMINLGGRIMILDFNYTSVIQNYLKPLDLNIQDVNYIHGKLNDPNNPIIFGYGDEQIHIMKKWRN